MISCTSPLLGHMTDYHVTKKRTYIQELQHSSLLNLSDRNCRKICRKYRHIISFKYCLHLELPQYNDLSNLLRQRNAAEYFVVGLIIDIKSFISCFAVMFKLPHHSEGTFCMCLASCIISDIFLTILHAFQCGFQCRMLNNKGCQFYSKEISKHLGQAFIMKGGLSAPPSANSMLDIHHRHNRVFHPDKSLIYLKKMFEIYK